MKTALRLLSLLAILAVSCSKERSFDNPDVTGPDGSGGVVGNGTRLTRMVTNYGSDSTVNTFSYNASGQLVLLTLTETDVDAGEEYNTQYLLTRNGTGTVQKIVERSQEYVAQLGVDSLVYQVNADASGRYTSKVAAFEYNGQTVKDSVAYTYDGNGRITQEHRFIVGGIEAQEVSRTDYTYIGNNIESQRLFSLDENTLQLEENSRAQFAYDTNIQPLLLGAEGIVLGYPDWVNANNLTGLQLEILDSPDENQDFTIGYTYLPNGRPATGAITTSGATVGTITFTYQ